MNFHTSESDIDAVPELLSRLGRQADAALDRKLGSEDQTLFCGDDGAHDAVGPFHFSVAPTICRIIPSLVL